MMALRNPATDRIVSFWRGLSRNEQIAVGVGGGVLVAGTLAAITLAFRDDVTPRRAIEIAPGCTGFAVLDMGLLRDQLRMLARDAAARGAVDPLALAGRYVRSIAPNCRTYPANTNQPSEARLYAAVARTLLDVMRTEQMLSETDEATWYEMLVMWAAGQGVAEADL